MHIFDWLRSVFAPDDEVGRASLEWLASSQYHEYWKAYQAMLPYKTDPGALRDHG